LNKGGFSLSKLLGVSKVKSDISKAIGVPLTKSGRNTKIGSTVIKAVKAITGSKTFIL